ncbi:hypothetical protein AMAG_05344 [Allomyces macrogynus ATCC 38327]|uniref:RGS domain-containing protein n=1 Tax=Allomyces macrogynus (strain ATCC 38327) TaxID=578462 RepID=A0A0L0SBN6_ALLM3|nr:hypothetical protein AMAG_05344 [Allomyces macrogynus ATCC 38327]|eukprot:KNE59896.1 hypothetical protein AMAG_05344 [Allomyces macrogynus ATCC 38327]
MSTSDSPDKAVRFASLRRDAVGDVSRHGSMAGPAGSSSVSNAAHQASASSLLSVEDDDAHESAESLETRFKNRAAYVYQKKATRASNHIVSFTRLFIQVAAASTIFPVTVESSRTIEYLAALIEAEYAFRYTAIATQFKDPRPEGERDNGGVEPRSSGLVVGLVCDVNGNALQFHDTIAAVLNLGDTVVVTHALDGWNPQAEGLTKITATVESKFDLYENPATADTPQLDGSADNRFLAVLRNVTGLNLFREYCVAQCNLESLLFWLDVEIFSGMAPEVRWLMAKYIFYMYVADQAPLKVNLAQEVRAELEQVVEVKRDVHLFDEAQFQIYGYLKKQVYASFEQSDQFREFLRFRSSSPQAYFSSKIRGDFGEHFKPDLELMLEVCGSAAISTRGVPSFIKDKYLNRVVKRYFPSAVTIEGYWDSIGNPTNQVRLRKVLKEKKLSKFFGIDRNSDRAQLAQHLQGQPATSSGATVSVPGSAYDLEGSLDSDEPRSDSPSDAGDSSSDDGNLFARKRRADKLTEFFGKKVDLMELQHTTTALSLPAPDPAAPAAAAQQARVVTVNELSSEDKAMLTRRSKKLRHVLGETLDENTAYESLLREIFNPGNNDRRRTSSNITAAAHRARTALLASMPEADPLEQELDLADMASSASSSSSSSLSDENTAEPSKRKLKTIRRRGKLQQVFGQGNLPPELVKKDRRKKIARATKLEKVFGELPPPEALSALQRKTIQHRRSIASLSLVLSDGEAVAGLLDYLMTQEKPAGSGGARPALGAARSHSADASATGMARLAPTSSVTAPDRRSPSITGGLLLPPSALAPISPTDSASSRTSLLTAKSDDDDSPTKERKLRKRKFKKLHKFFGDNVDPALLIEQNILAKLEKEIEEDIGTDESSMSVLRADLAVLREQVKVITDQMRVAASPDGGSAPETPIDDALSSADDSAPSTTTLLRRNASTASHESAARAQASVKPRSVSSREPSAQESGLQLLGGFAFESHPAISLSEVQENGGASGAGTGARSPHV